MRPFCHLAFFLALLPVGCDSPRVEESSSETMTFEMGENRPRVLVRLDEGSIEVVATESPGIELDLVKRARAFDRKGARSLLSVIRTDASLENDTLTIRASRGLRPEISFGSGPRTDITLRVPRNIDLDLRTLDGGIDLRGVAGSITAESGDGRIRLREVQGTVTLRTSDGSILGSDLEGDFDVLTDDGRIELDGDFGVVKAVTSDGSIRVGARATTASFADWTIRSSDGSIELTLPASLSARVAATVGDGTLENALERFEGRQGPRGIEGRLGRGGPLILVTTMDGNITLEGR